MVKVEARLVAAAAGAPPIWVQTLERDAKATLARVAGIDDGEGGLTTWGLAVAGVPELESRNLSSRGWHASFHWDGTHLTVARRMIPPTTNGLLTTDGKAAPDEIRLKPGESFRIARFHFTVVAGYPPSNEWDASIPPELTAPLKPRGRDGNRSNEVVRSEEEVLKTPLVDSDRVIAGLLDIVPAESGLHTIGHLPRRLREADASRAADLRRITASPIARFSIAPVGVNGLVLGFGGVSPAQIKAGVGVLAEVLEKQLTAC